MPGLRESQGFQYLQDTKFDPNSLRTKTRLQITAASPFKEYPDAEKVALPHDLNEKQANLWQLLQDRRSGRNYGEGKMSLEDLALLCWAAQGVTAQAGRFLFRTAPSAGALYPIETYLAVEQVDEVPAGIYHYDVRTFSLERLSDTPPGAAVAEAALGQNFVGRAAVTFIWSAVMRRNMSKYGHRGMRYLCMDVGHIAQNLLLAAQALDLAACPVAAFFDDQLNSLLGLDGEEESVLYLTAVGRQP